MTGQETTKEMEAKNIGLRGIVVADSTISKVDGEKGILIYRGYDIFPLAREGTFEEVIYLLLQNELPGEKNLKILQNELRTSGFLPDPVVAAMQTLPREAVPMDVLQAVMPVLAMHDLELGNASWDGCYRKALRLISRIPLVVSAWERIRSGRDVVAPKKGLSHAANFLYTLHGSEPDEEAARIMDVILVLHADHGFNASTFTARQIGSTRAHIYAAIAGALGSLSGELHGGANYRVYQMLRHIGSADKAKDYVTRTLDNKERIMGMGHAVYRVTDPRARILGPMAERLAGKAGRSELYEIAEEVRKTTTEEMRKRKGREIYANVDFYSAIVNALIGIPVDMFTPVFAIGRIAGWCAHYLEEFFGGEHAKPTLYRPRAEYVGRYCGLEGCTWTPMKER
jgi:citrate synthase